MTERRVSQRTGNTETCQREQEGEMERWRERYREEGGWGLKWQMGLKRDVNERENTREGEGNQSEISKGIKYRWCNEETNTKNRKKKDRQKISSALKSTFSGLL